MRDPLESDLALECPACGYNCRGLTKNQCPERGQWFRLESITRPVRRYSSLLALNYTLFILSIVLFLLALLSVLRSYAAQEAFTAGFALTFAIGSGITAAACSFTARSEQSGVRGIASVMILPVLVIGYYGVRGLDIFL